MKNILFIFPIIIFLSIIFIFFYFLINARDPTNLPSILLNKTAPKFSTKSLINNENIIFDEEFKKNTLLVNFFATWCIPCETEIEYLKLFSELNGLKIIGINYKDDPNKAIKWLEKLGNPYSSIAQDLTGDIAIDWGVYGIPETFIVNKKSIIKYRHVGPITKDNFKEIYYLLEKVNNDKK